MTNNSNELSKMLRQQRRMAELTLRQLGAKSGVSASHLGRIERGERFPSAHILRKLAKPLGLAETELLTSAGYLSPQPSAVESEAQLGRLDPHVANVLAQEPVDMQRAMVSLLIIVKAMAESLR